MPECEGKQRSAECFMFAGKLRQQANEASFVHDVFSTCYEAHVSYESLLILISNRRTPVRSLHIEDRWGGGGKRLGALKKLLAQ